MDYLSGLFNMIVIIRSGIFVTLILSTIFFQGCNESQQNIKQKKELRDVFDEALLSKIEGELSSELFHLEYQNSQDKELGRSLTYSKPEIEKVRSRYEVVTCLRKALYP